MIDKVHVISLESDGPYVYKTIWRYKEIRLLCWSLFCYALICVLF